MRIRQRGRCIGLVIYALGLFLMIMGVSLPLKRHCGIDTCFDQNMVHVYNKFRA